MKGKYAQKAALRKAELEVTTDLATYQRKVAALTAEVRELSEKLVRQDRAHQAETRRLRAERDEGAAPQVQALSLSLKAAVEARDRAVRHARQLQKHWDEQAPTILRHFENEHGLTHAEAWEMVLRMIGARPDVTVIEDAVGVNRRVTDPEAARRIQQARGQRGRSSGKSTTTTALGS